MSDNDEILSRFAAGEGEHGPPAPRPDEEDPEAGADTDHDTDRTSPGSEDPVPDRVADDVDASQIRAVPGTGGPDDAGDIEVDPDDLNLPGRS